MNKIDYEAIDKARKTLGLGETADLSEIKTAYRCLSKKWHPDRCKKGEQDICHEKMKEINKSYKTVLGYIDDYRYSFAEEKIMEDDPQERWKKQFGDDPVWGSGESWRSKNESSGSK